LVYTRPNSFIPYSCLLKYNSCNFTACMCTICCTKRVHPLVMCSIVSDTWCHLWHLCLLILLLLSSLIVIPFDNV
jgi:hypothetical protein